MRTPENCYPKPTVTGTVVLANRLMPKWQVRREYSAVGGDSKELAFDLYRRWDRQRFGCLSEWEVLEHRQETGHTRECDDSGSPPANGVAVRDTELNSPASDVPVSASWSADEGVRVLVGVARYAGRAPGCKLVAQRWVIAGPSRAVSESGLRERVERAVAEHWDTQAHGPKSDYVLVHVEYGAARIDRLAPLPA